MDYHLPATRRDLYNFVVLCCVVGPLVLFAAIAVVSIIIELGFGYSSQEIHWIAGNPIWLLVSVALTGKWLSRDLVPVET